MVLEARPTATPAEVARLVLNGATQDVLASVSEGSPNLLLFIDPSAATAPPTETVPIKDPEPSPEPDPEPDPEQPSGPPCTNCDVFTATLTRTGDAHTWPFADGSGYETTSRAGLHQGWLVGPADAEFDLVLEYWQARRWRVVASSTGASSMEELHYAGKAGTYRWRVVSAQGSGGYELYLSLP